MMVDPRNKKLAQILVHYSVKIKAKDKVWIQSSSPLGLPLAKQVYQETLLAGAYPYLDLGTDELDYFFFQHATPDQLQLKPQVKEFLAHWSDKIIRIYCSTNEQELANINSEKLLVRTKALKTVKDIILQKDWVLTVYPTPALAQTASLSNQEMEDIFFKACLKDWPKINRQLKKLERLMDNAGRVEIIGQDTHLTLSLKGRLAQACAGTHNMPDGEVFAAPLDNSANGFISFDFPSLREGKLVEGVKLYFKKGKVIKFDATKNRDFLAAALKVDPGACRLGEFAIGANYGLKKPLLNTLFDEKIGGTIHLALGNAYPEVRGGGKNKSAIHWDLVKDMRLPGSQLKINQRLVLKDGHLIL